MPKKEKILVIEDDEDIRDLLRYNLAKAGCDVSCAASGEEGLKMAREDEVDLIVLDLMLPGIDGLGVCRTLRSNAATREIPIVMLTAKGEETDIVAGLETGADDYVTKPFSPRVLLARIRSVLRRKGNKSRFDIEADLVLENLSISPRRHEVLVDNEPIQLTATEFRILNVLARRRGWVLTRDQIVNAVHGDGYPVTDRSVDVQIVGLRRKMGEIGNHIETVRGVGYRFRE